MNTCIFCRSTTNNFSREEHLLPESLGGDIVLPLGLVCDPCNQYFGKEVEREALATPILNFHRASMSIPTKKGKYAQYLGPGFEIHGDKSGMATIHLSPEPSQQLGPQGEIFVPVEMFEFGSLIQLLLKIGLELAAMLQYDVYASAFDEVRTAARAPRLNTTWPVALGALKIEDVQEGADAGVRCAVVITAHATPACPAVAGGAARSMKVRFLLDENLSPRLQTGLWHRNPHMDVLRVGDPGAPALGTLDPAILQYVEQAQRLLITNNRVIMPDHLHAHQGAGGHHWGLVWICPSA